MSVQADIVEAMVDAVGTALTGWNVQGIDQGGLTGNRNAAVVAIATDAQPVESYLGGDDLLTGRVEVQLQTGAPSMAAAVDSVLGIGEHVLYAKAPSAVFYRDPVHARGEGVVGGYPIDTVTFNVQFEA